MPDDIALRWELERAAADDYLQLVDLMGRDLNESAASEHLRKARERERIIGDRIESMALQTAEVIEGNVDLHIRIANLESENDDLRRQLNAPFAEKRPTPAPAGGSENQAADNPGE